MTNKNEQVAKKNKVELLKGAGFFGLAVLGNGAIIKKKPPFNVLALALNILYAMLSVIVENISIKHTAPFSNNC